jgi:ferredoxin-NADP reductase
MITFIDDLLNRITMYRLMLYYLIALLVIAAVFGVFGILSISPVSLIASTLIILTACSITNKVFAAVLKIPTNVESIYITACILALIISPISLQPFDMAGFWFLVAASVIAMASKYILAVHKKHIFNPAAIAVAITAITLGQYASWWIGGNLPMLAFVLIGGLLVARKIQHFDLILAFFAAALASVILTDLSFDPITTAEKAFIHTTLLFFGFVMLTEPLTTPPTRPLRIIYGLLVGALFAPGIHIGSIYSTPELALVVGNIFSYAVSPKRKYLLELVSKKEIGSGGVYDFAFAAGGKSIDFRPGQYMEWTLAHPDSDSRGNRRYFTIAASPTESEIHLGVKFPAGADGTTVSTYKKKMLALEPGERLMLAGQLAGDFTLPHDPDRKLVFIAGGIGITPFRSMIKYLSDHDERRDIVLLYSNREATEVAYREIFDEATKTIGLKTIYIATETGQRIDAAFIEREIPDYRARMFYISGPRAMIVAFEKTLHDMAVPRSHIKTDFFPGFV